MEFEPTIRFDFVSAIDATVLFSSDVYDVLTAGGLSAPSIRVTPDGRFNGTADLPDDAGIACNQGDCRFVLEGFLAGDGGTHAGLVYTIRDDLGNNVTRWIDGSAAFRTVDSGGGTPPPPPPPSGTVRTDQYVVYAAGNNIGIDARTSRPNSSSPLPLDVTYSSSGAPIAY